MTMNDSVRPLAETANGDGIALRARDVRKSFGGLVAVKDVSLDVTAGTITALIGPNGAGKTTLFNVLTRFDSIDGGSIELFGQPIGALSPWRVARMGLIRSFQSPVGFASLSIWENLMVGGSAVSAESLGKALSGRRTWISSERRTHDRARQVLEELDLWDLRDTPLADLSGGDVKLVDFARQLMADPKVLLLDEPAAGVDPASVERLAGQILAIKKRGITVLIVDHNISFVFGVADYVYVLDRGSIIAEGPPSAISRDPKVIEVYLGGKS